jgi:AraC-like DNA-binding protein
MLGSEYAPISGHLPHEALTRPMKTTRRYFACAPRFAERPAGFTRRTADLARPLNDDQFAHEAVVHYLTTVTHSDTGVAQSVRTMVRQRLPTGTVTPELIAAQLNLHPKALQRKLSHEGMTFGGLVDQTSPQGRRAVLRDTHITLSSHVAPGARLRRTEPAHALLPALVRQRAHRLSPVGALQRPLIGPGSPGTLSPPGLATPSALSDSAPGSATYWEPTIQAATRRAVRAVIAVVSDLCGTVGWVVSQVGPALVLC